MWGLDAMATTFVAPHSLHARPLVVPRGAGRRRLEPDAGRPGCAVLVDGHRGGRRGPRRARHDPARRRSAPCSASLPERDVRPPLPRRASRPDARRRDRCGARARPSTITACFAACGSRTSSSSARPSSSSRPASIALTRRDRRRQDDLRPGDRPAARRQGRRGRRRRRRRARRTSRPSSTCRTGSSTRRGSRRSRELRPDDEPGLVARAARRSPTGARAHTPGAARRARGSRAATERLIAMSGQFEQRRLARPALPAGRSSTRSSAPTSRPPASAGARRLARARRRRRAASRSSSATPAPSARGSTSSRALVERHRRARARGGGRRCAPSGSACGTSAELGRGRRRGRGRASPPTTVTARASLAAAAERAVGACSSGSRPSSRRVGERAPRARRPAERGRQRPAPVRRVARRRPDRGSRRSRSGSSSIADAAAPVRRARASRSCSSGARRRCAELERVGRRATRSSTPRPSTPGRRRAVRRRRGCALGGASGRSAEPFAAAVARELGGPRARGGRVPASSCASASRARPGRDEAAFLVRPNPGLPFAPVAETASGGELSRVALAIAAVAGGETIVLDEIDAGIGGVTAHRVAGDAQAPRRARAGDHDHPPAADRERRRPASPRREGARRPDPHADRRASTTPSGATSSSGCSAARSSSAP